MSLLIKRFFTFGPLEQLENEQVSVISIDIYKNRLLIDLAHLP